MEVLVKHENGHRFVATCRGHTVTTGRGEDGNESRDGMWPAQLFAASIGMCIGGYVAEFCKKQHIPYDDMTIELSRRVEVGPSESKLSRTSRIDAKVRLGVTLSEQQKQGIIEAADQCHITESIRGGMQIVCSLTDKEGG